MLTQQEWFVILAGDILACKTEAGLRRWAKNFRDDIRQKCPEYLKELREKYLHRLDDIKGGKQ